MFCVATWLGTGESSQGLNRETRFCLYTWLGTVGVSHGSTERLSSVYIHGKVLVKVLMSQPTLWNISEFVFVPSWRKAMSSLWRLLVYNKSDR